MSKLNPMQALEAAILKAKAQEEKTPKATERQGYRHADPKGFIVETAEGPILRLELPLTVDPDVRTGSSKGLQLQRATRTRLQDAEGRPVEILGQQVNVAYTVDVTLPRALWNAEAVKAADAKRKALRA